ncbi:hypothetical protein C8T65DRAFT_63592 [Cerioporus squamosus]|nr:hypothetical protein C8T65DRAFT_63592 [Cerioporus squamosus]
MPLSRPARNTRAYPPRPWKGKERELAARDGGTEGTVIDLELSQDSPYQSAYVAPVYVGSGGSKHLVQVDTGSSDLVSTPLAVSLLQESSIVERAGSARECMSNREGT